MKVDAMRYKQDSGWMVDVDYLDWFHLTSEFKSHKRFPGFVFGHDHQLDLERVRLASSPKWKKKARFLPEVCFQTLQSFRGDRIEIRKNNRQVHPNDISVWIDAYSALKHGSFLICFDDPMRNVFLPTSPPERLSPNPCHSSNVYPPALSILLVPSRE